MTPPGPAPATRLLLLLDLVLVTAFAASGRASHAEGGGMMGVLITAWPFLVGCLVGQVGVRAWRHPAAVWPTGVVVWLSTLVLGMVLRLLTGSGTAPTFVVVAAVVLAVFLLVPRAVLHLVRARRGS